MTALEGATYVSNVLLKRLYFDQLIHLTPPPAGSLFGLNFEIRWG